MVVIKQNSSADDVVRIELGYGSLGAYSPLSMDLFEYEFQVTNDNYQIVYEDPDKEDDDEDISLDTVDLINCGWIADKVFVIDGLDDYEYSIAEDIITGENGIIQETVTNETDYLFFYQPARKKSKELVKAEKLNSKGNSIQLLSIIDFCKIV